MATKPKRGNALRNSLIIILGLQIVLYCISIFQLLADIGVRHDTITFTGLGPMIGFYILCLPALVLAIIYLIKVIKKQFKISVAVIVLIGVVIALIALHSTISTAIFIQSYETLYPLDY